MTPRNAPPGRRSLASTNLAPSTPKAFDASHGGDLRIARYERKVKCGGGCCDQAVTSFCNHVETLGKVDNFGG